MHDRVITLRHRLATKNKRRLAWQMYRFASTFIEGDVFEPATWRRAFRRLGCGIIVYSHPGATPGEYSPTSEDPRYIAMVAYNVAYSRITRVHALAHEFGHHLLNIWVARNVYEAAVVRSYRDDPRDARHQIARLFERMILRG